MIDRFSTTSAERTAFTQSANGRPASVSSRSQHATGPPPDQLPVGRGHPVRHRVGGEQHQVGARHAGQVLEQQAGIQIRPVHASLGQGAGGRRDERVDVHAAGSAQDADLSASVW